MPTGLANVDWAAAVARLLEDGWVRLQGTVEADTCLRLIESAPPTWVDNPEEQIGTVRQAGMAAGVLFADGPAVVRDFGELIWNSINDVRPASIAELPFFTDVQWGRSRHDGTNFITAHRDPPRVGGVLAITTLYGAARFRVWHDGRDPRRAPDPDQLTRSEWDTAGGDLVLLRCNGWPTPESLCPVHEAESPPNGERMILTLRHNKGGPGADWFAP